MGVNLESVVFDPAEFNKELNRFSVFLLDDFKGTKGFAKTFGDGHIKFFGLLVIGRSANLDDAKRNRLDWRTEKVLIDSHAITCMTLDDLHASLSRRFNIYRAAPKLETRKKGRT